jgi:hypothetical protein
LRRGIKWKPSRRVKAKATSLCPCESTKFFSTLMSVQWRSTPSIIAATPEEETLFSCE